MRWTGREFLGLPLTAWGWLLAARGRIYLGAADELTCAPSASGADARYRRVRADLDFAAFFDARLGRLFVDVDLGDLLGAFLARVVGDLTLVSFSDARLARLFVDVDLGFAAFSDEPSARLDLDFDSVLFPGALVGAPAATERTGWRVPAFFFAGTVGGGGGGQVAGTVTATSSLCLSSGDGGVGGGYFLRPSSTASAVGR